MADGTLINLFTAFEASDQYFLGKMYMETIEKQYSYSYTFK